MQYVSCHPQTLYSSGGYYDDEVLLEELLATGLAENKIRPAICELYPASSYRRHTLTSVECHDLKFTNSVLDQFEVVKREFKTAAASIVVEIDNCLTYKSVIYTSLLPDAEAVYETLRKVDRPWTEIIEKGEPDCIFPLADRKHIFVGSVGSGNYGHWLTDDLPRLKYLITNDEPTTLYFPGFGQDMDKVRSDAVNILVGQTRDIVVRFIDPGKIVGFERLTYITPVSYHPVVKSPGAVDFIKSIVTLAPALPAPILNNLRLFVLRSPGQYRKIINESEVVEVLKYYGFIFVEPSKLAFHEQISLFAAARVIVGVMGATMTNTVFSPSGAKVVHLAPMGWHEPYFWDLANLLNHDYVIIYGATPNKSNFAPMSDFMVDCTVLRKVLEAYV